MTLGLNGIYYSKTDSIAKVIEQKGSDLNSVLQINVLAQKELKKSKNIGFSTLENPFYLKRQKRQYKPKYAQLFSAISKHNPKNPTDTTLEIKDLLKEVDIDYQDAEGDTFLHAATQEGHQDIVKLILDAGADITIQNKEHKTALDLANELGSNPNRQKIIDLLVRPRLLNIGDGSKSSASHKVPNMPETYPASGLKHSLHGNVYQLKLLMLFLNRGLAGGYNFRLSTEWDAAEKFDDLVFRYTDLGQVTYRFLQAKHKQNEAKKITIGDLFTTDKNGEFNLEKYFISYLRIKKNSIFQDANLEDFIVCTNIDFDLASVTQNQARMLKQIHTGRNKGKEILLEEINKSDVFFKDRGTRYKLQKSKDLIAHLQQGSELQEEIQGQGIDIDVEIDDFLEKLVFAVDQPNEIKLGELIAQEIGEKYNLIDADLITDNFLKEMLNWMKEKGPKGEEGRFLSQEDGKRCFQLINQKIDKLKIAGPTSKYSQKLKSFGVIFKSDQLTQIENFLRIGQKQVLCFISPYSTKLSAIKVNQALIHHSRQIEDSYIFLSLDGLLRLQNRVLNTFEAENTDNLLIIECKNKADNLEDLYAKLKTIISNNPQKKIILITKNDHDLAHLFGDDSQMQKIYQKEEDSIKGLTDLQALSQNKVLEKTVYFQGIEMPLNRLVDDNSRGIIHAEILSDLFNDKQRKIGKKVPELTQVDKECYIKRTFKPVRGKEGDIVEEIADEIAIIADKPGMGKSALLVYLAEQTKQKDPLLWVITINLIEHTQNLSKWTDKGIKKNFINFLSETMDLSTSLEKALLKKYFNSPNKIVVFIDGFDEISPVYKDEVIDLLLALKETKIRKTWITTRLHMLDELENGLGISSSYSLHLLSESEQKELLKKTFRNNLRTIDEKRLEFCTQKLFKAFVDNVVDKSFTAVPLQLNMIGEIFQEEFKAFYDDQKQSEFLLPHNFNLASLYEKFIKYKYISFQEHLSVDITKPQVDSIFYGDYQNSLKELQLLALYILYDANMHYLSINEDISILPGTKTIDPRHFERAEDLDSVLFKVDGIHPRSLNNEDDSNSLFFPSQKKIIDKMIEEIKKGKGYFGMIDSVLNERPNFVHITFLEYFAAQKIVNIFQQREDFSVLQLRSLHDFLQQLFFSQGTGSVQTFFDDMVIKEQEYPLHAAVLRDDQQGMENVLEENKADINALDPFDRTALHLSIIYGYGNLVIELVNRKANINIVDQILGGPIVYAIVLQNLEAVSYLLKKGATLPNALPGRYAIDPWCMLKIIREENIFLLKKLIGKYGYDDLSKCMEPFELTLIGVAARLNKHNIIKYLIDKKLCNINSHSNLINHKTALHYAVQRDNFETVKFLIRNKANIYAQTKFFAYLPINLVVSQNSKIYKLLSNIDDLMRGIHGPYLKNPLDILQSMKEDETLDLVEVINDRGVTIFHYAASTNNRPLVNYLIANHININVRDNIHRTPLHYAVEDNHIDMLKLLVDSHAFINAKDLKERSPLHYAVMYKYYEIGSLLLEKRANIHVRDVTGKTLLHYAVEQGDHRMGKLLLENGINPNLLDHSGKAPLHYVSKHRAVMEEMIKALKEGNVNFNIVSKISGKTPLHYAVERGDHKLVELLLESGANPNILDRLEKTPLHYAILPEKYNKRIVEFLIEANVDFDVQDQRGKTALDIVKNNLYDVRILKEIESLLINGPLPKRRRIEAQSDQQKIFTKLEKELKSDIPGREIISVRQGLYLPSFKKRNSKIAGKCAAITRAFSQSLFLGEHKEFLRNLEVSAELYERLASGKQISQREERSIFSLSKVLDGFEKQRDFSTSSLPSYLSPRKRIKTREDLSHYIGQRKGNFAIHLSTSNHVVAIYRIGEVYSYFDSNLALVSNLRGVDQLMSVVERSMKLTDYEVLEEGFLVEPFDVVKANQGLSIEQKQSLTDPIQTERALLSLQDQNLGPIDFNGQKLHRKTLYDMGAKLYDKGVPLLIHSQMHDLVENLTAGKIKLTAREYLEMLRGRSKESIQEIVQATSFPFEGSINEIENAHAIRELVISKDVQKLNLYELKKILETPMEGSLKTIPYYLEVAKSRYSHPSRLMNSAGRISLFRGIHGTLSALQQGDVLEFSLGAGEIGFSLFSQLIEDKVVKFSPKMIKQMKFGIHVTRGVGGFISNPFDILDLIRSSISLSEAEKYSKEWRDAVTNIAFSSASITSSVIFSALGTIGAGTGVGLGIMAGQGIYNGVSMIVAFKKYRLTTKENIHLFLHTFFYQPVPESVGYISSRKEMVNGMVHQGWERVLNNHKVVAYAMGLGTTFPVTREINCRPKPVGLLSSQRSCEEVTEYFIKAGHGVIDIFRLQNKHRLSRMRPYNFGSDYVPLCMPECPQNDERYGKDCTYGVEQETINSKNLQYYCENAAVIGHTSRMEYKAERDKEEGELIFDLNLVNSGRVRANQAWKNVFVIATGTASIYGGNYTSNRFILTESGFEGRIFGGKNSTNILDVSTLESDQLSYKQGNITLVEKDVGYTNLAHNLTALISKAGRRDEVDCTDEESLLVDCKGGKDDDPDIITNCKKAVIYSNTVVNCNDDIDYTFYVKPEIGNAKIYMNHGRASIVFTETELLHDKHHVVYSQESNTLILEINLSDSLQKFTLHISNFFDEENHVNKVTLIDKHNSFIEPILDKDQPRKEVEIDTFILRAEIEAKGFNSAVSDWYKATYPNKKGYQIYGIVKDLENGMRPYGIFGSSKSDVISLKDVRFAKAGNDRDIYSLLVTDMGKGPNLIEIDNESEDKKLDMLYISTPLKEAKVEGCNLQLILEPDARIQVKDYFLNDEHRHLALIDNEKKMFIVLPTEGERSCTKAIEGTWEISDIQRIQAIPFYSATDSQNFYSISEEQMNNHSVIAIDANLNQTSFYRNYDDLLLRENNVHKNASLLVNLQGFYHKKNMSLYFCPDNYQLDLIEVARLAINYQEEEKNAYEISVKEYLIDLHSESTKSTVIDHALEAPKIGVLLLPNVAPESIVISANNHDLILSNSNHTLTLKNWHNFQNRISILKFDEELEVIDIEKFDINQISEMISQINKAVLSRAIEQSLQRLNHTVLNGILYLLIARNAENVVIGAHACLGFDSIKQQQSFIASYQPYYNEKTLKQILCKDYPDEAVKALIWLVARGCMLSNKTLLMKCFGSLVNSSLIDSLHAKCSNDRNIDTFSVLMLIRTVIRASKEALKQNIIEDLSCALKKQENMNRGTRNRRFALAEKSSFLLEYIPWFGNGISSLFSTIPALNSRTIPVNDTKEAFTRKSSSAVIKGQIDINGGVQLLDVLLAKIGKRKIYTPVEDNLISFQQAQVLEGIMMRDFKQVLDKTAIASGISVKNLKFDPRKISISKQIRDRQYSKIFQILYIAGEKACPPFKQKDKFLSHLKLNLEEMLKKAFEIDQRRGFAPP